MIPLIIGIVLVIAGFFIEFVVYRYSANRSAQFRTEGSKLQIYRDKKWHTFIVKGINLDSGRQGFSGGGRGITKAEYKRWFAKVSGMNANVIRVNNILPPDFYQAFFEYNLLADKPLFLLHGISAARRGNKPPANAYDEQFNNDLYEQIRRTVDVVHGRAILKRSTSNSSRTYSLNISPYVMGYILGEDTGADFVIQTNQMNVQVMGFEGDYLFTEKATPYEAWLAALGNYAISYEVEKYGGPQKLISWLNQPATDPIEHLSVKDLKKEVASGVNFEHIQTTEKYSAGIFASFQVNTESQDYRNFQSEYVQYVDTRGKYNAFEGYLADLRACHTMPLLVAEFGRAAGGSAGGLAGRGDEIAAADMFDSIINAGFSGGITSSWPDEWFKESMVSEKKNSTAIDEFNQFYTVVQNKFAEYN